MPKEKLQQLYPYVQNQNSAINLINSRLGNVNTPKYYKSTIDSANEMAKRLQCDGGFAEQNRMIKEKRRTLDKATLYSYQGAWVKRQIYDFEPTMEGVKEAPPVRALINPNKLKQDYDDKIISVGYEHGFKVGDVFNWCNTGTYWLIYLQDLTELAYFKGDIRKCSYEIEWEDENGPQRTYIALRGPVETRIDYIQKHEISVDNPNYSLNFMMPKTTANLKQFKRYSKFYLQDLAEGESNTCWRVEAVDSFSMPGIIEVNAVEYYANEIEDDVENGKVGSLIKKPLDPNIDNVLNINGETFIKPKKEYIYYIDDSTASGEWYFSDSRIPIVKEVLIDDNKKNSIKIKWNSSYSGQFDLYFEDKKHNKKYNKTIIVESLF